MAAAMAAHSRPPLTPSPMPGVTGTECPRPPLSPHALGSKNGGRECLSGGTPAVARGGAAVDDSLSVPVHYQFTPSLLNASGPVGLKVIGHSSITRLFK